MKLIRLALTEAGLTEERIASRTLGGAEMFFLLWEKYLVTAGYVVSRWPEEAQGEYDLCIHSNFFDHNIKAKKHLLWGGGCEVKDSASFADKIIILTDYMRELLGWPAGFAEIIPAPFDHELLAYRTNDFVPHRIVSNSNPSRFFDQVAPVIGALESKGVDFEWHFCGGNKLYCETFPEKFSFETACSKLIYRGVLNRKEMIEMLNSGHVLAYPSFDGITWETQGVAFLEAAALGLPVVLTEKRPFTDVMPEAFLCKDAVTMAAAIEDLFNSEGRIEYAHINRYDSDVVFEKLLTIVREMTGGGPQ
jgi:glycosyltransferase involved in cell wall biosynthesis